MTTIAGKAVLVTGASRGIGQALVAEALDRGAGRVYAAARRPLSHPDARVTPLLLDVTSPAQVSAAAAAVQSLDILINNAGLGLGGELAGPVDTDMSADLAIPKASAQSVASAILTGVERGDEEIFPDDIARTLFGDWAAGPVKAFEQQNAALLAA